MARVGIGFSYRSDLRLDQLDPDKRRQIYYDIQRIAKNEMHRIDLYYSPICKASHSNVKKVFQNPMGRFMLKDTSSSLRRGTACGCL